ncbi:HYES hydrolase, partial [Bombycilla garrulus]|nr:HYES hydrolase [Bombycilla garrulus]
GLVTGVVAVTWLDDDPARVLAAAWLLRVRSEFRVLLESCRIGSAKPDPEIFLRACQDLRVTPNEV